MDVPDDVGTDARFLVVPTYWTTRTARREVTWAGELRED